jgi:ABC-2 type transport system permease protein
MGRPSSSVHALRVVRAHLVVGLLNAVQYRTDFAIAMVNAVISLGSAVIGLSVIFDNTADLNGWTADEMLVLVGVHFLIGGLIGVVIQPSMAAMMEGIRLGTFDFVLTKPADAQVLASSQVVAPQAGINVVVGLVVIGVGVVRTGNALDPGSLAFFLPTLLAGLAIVYGFLLILSTLAFWFVRLDNVLQIFQTLFGNAGRWPVTIFPIWMRYLLTFVVPVAFAVTVPVQALTGRLSVGGAMLAVGVAALFLAVARAFWRIALRRYTGASA